MSSGGDAGGAGGPDRDSAKPGHDNGSVESKLSQELSNWRSKRTSSRARRPDRPSQNFSSEPARTIKVRGHETLVVRKPKLVQKSPPPQTPSNQ